MASKRQILKQILGLTVAILLTHVLEVATNDFQETSMGLQLSYIDEPQHHIRQRRADPFTDYMAEIEIHASDISVINKLKIYLNELVQNHTVFNNVTLLDSNFTTVCNMLPGTTDYQCNCENQYFWPCDNCKKYGSCGSITNNQCSCINAFPNNGHFCQPISEMTDATACHQRVITMSVEINETFDTSLTNPTDDNYKTKALQIQSSINKGYKFLSNYVDGSAKVTGFRSGSIIADYTINSISDIPDFTSANINVSSLPLVQNAFALTEKTMLFNRTDQIYPKQNVTLYCPQSVMGPIMWKVNENDPDSTKYSISPDNSTLTMKRADISDSGRYSCIIQTNSLPYIQWQNIVIEQEPIIIVGNNEQVYPCKEKTVKLTCCVNGDYSIEWVLNGTVQTSGSGCITVNHTIQNTNCKENSTYTCQLQNLRQLLNYSYSKSSVTVKTSEEQELSKFHCNEPFELGILNNKTEKPCDAGKEGSIIYTCVLGGWNLTNNNCVVRAIKELQTRAQVLVVEDIPEFVKNLSIKTNQFKKDIIESPATIQTIVKILTTVADISQNITINKTMIEDFLNIVENITSDGSKNTWTGLNNGNVTERKASTNLLQAIETISSHLSDGDFSITTQSIQLYRNITVDISKNIDVISYLNNLTEIRIPNVPKSTAITIIIFTKLDNVLPTRNTSNNDTKTSENIINGDVVVVQVNQTIHNISFTFDTKNTSLKNPQSVFWNFSLDRWDSNGCKVKNFVNKTVTYECNHTTSFSILMSPFAIDNPALDATHAIDYITYVGVAISLASLILCLIIEMIVWKSVTRNDTAYMRHVSIVNIAVSLLIADICFIIVAAFADQKQLLSVGRCSPVVFFMHFFYLAVFFWMFISALLLLYRTVMVFSQMSRTNMMVIAFTVGYCAPLLIAVITVASTAGPENYISKKNLCWLNWDESKALLAFVVPALTIVAFNLMVLIVVLCKMVRRGVGALTNSNEKHTLVVIARCVAILTPIFGLTWGFGIGIMVSPEPALHIVFAILNSFQGFFVLVFGILLDSKVRESLAGKLSLKNLSSSPTRSTNAGTSSTGGLGILRWLRRRNVYNLSDPSPATSANSSSGSHLIPN
ncbi:adhesion G protein-coupled receptor F4-like [Paramisgurnus dabryanus]|uniref:adhesion G protein-coupled receptor F4-like n=1 Tax=Paramisgurnus dabryanus TaxID=90735 RepID=UPI003CCF8C12